MNTHRKNNGKEFKMKTRKPLGALIGWNDPLSEHYMGEEFIESFEMAMEMIDEEMIKKLS